MSEPTNIRFDVAAIQDTDLRAAIRTRLTRELHWTPAKTAGANAYGPSIYVGNAARLSGRPDFLSRRFECPVGILALVGSGADEAATSDLVEWSGTSRLTLALEFESEARHSEDRVLHAAERLARRLAPDHIRSARYADGVLFVVFGDGLAHAFEWKRTRILSQLEAVQPESAIVGEDFDSVVVLDRNGREVDIDALSLRRLADAGAAAESNAQFSSARMRIGARLRGMRESANLSQERLSKRTGLPQESISRLERGSRTPRLETLMKLATGLEVPLESLLRTIESKDG